VKGARDSAVQGLKHRVWEGTSQTLSKVQSAWILARHQWLMPVILVTWEDEIGRIVVSGQLGQMVLRLHL
jgi:hypothetical protein